MIIFPGVAKQRPEREHKRLGEGYRSRVAAEGKGKELEEALTTSMTDNCFLSLTLVTCAKKYQVLEQTFNLFESS